MACSHGGTDQHLRGPGIAAPRERKMFDLVLLLILINLLLHVFVWLTSD
jgi:hypothetical protein